MSNPPAKHSETPQSADKLNTSKCESNGSFASLSCSYKGKQIPVTKQVDQISKTPSVIQKMSPILTPSLSGLYKAFDYMAEVDCNISKSNGLICNGISEVTETLSYIHISFPKNRTNPKSATKNTVPEKNKSDWFTFGAMNKITTELCS